MNSSVPLFETKTAVVTGAARGIGLSIAKHLASLGAKVVLADFNDEAGQQAEAALRAQGFNAHYSHVDLSEKGAAAQLIQATCSTFGGVDLLINNARSRSKVDFFEQTEDTWDLELKVGLRAAFFASQAFVLQARHNKTPGAIVNIASVASNLVTNESPAYHALKAGLAQMTKYVAVHAAPYSVRCNAVLPGLIIQDEHRARFEADDNEAYRAQVSNYQPSGLPGNTLDVARAVAFLADPANTYLSGACLVLDGAATVQEPFGLLLRKALNQP